MNIYITLDYELFFGDITGTPENCLIRPMDDLLISIEKYNIKLIIFVDAAYLLRMNQLKDVYSQINKDYKLVTNHIIDLKEKGHDIQLHFHPQWLYSNWNEKENRWILDFNHYKLSDMDLEFAYQSFSDAKNILDTLIQEKTNAFRAGGYSLETFKDYIRLFKLNGITVDSSVFRGAKMQSDFLLYDYRKIPSKIIYNFSDSIKKENENGEFKELSINSCKWNPIYYLFVIRPKLFDYNPKIIYKDGIPIVRKIKISYLSKLKKLFEIKIFQACIDGPMSNALDIVYNCVVKQNIKDFVLIGHPKNFSDQSINNLVNFISKTYKKNKFQTSKNLK